MIVSHSALRLTALEDGTFSLAAPYEVFMDGIVYAVPAGFITDGASIPRWLWRLCGHPFEEPRLYAAVLHDYFYQTHAMGRAKCDALFRDIQRALGRGTFVTALEYRALRLFGGSHW